jgi:phosphoglycerol transferase
VNVRKRVWLEVALSAAVAVLVLVLLTLSLRLWKADVHVPLAYHEDANSHAALIKNTLERGWYETNPRLGAPFQQEFHDFPMADNLHLAVAKAAGLVIDDYAVFVNLYYLFGFVLAAWTALWVLRWLGITPAVSVVMSVLFTMVPYHFLRGEVHFFLAAIYPIPLAVFLLISALRGDRLTADRPGWRRFASWPFLRYVLAALILGSASSYYAIFTLLLLGVAGLAAAFRGRSLRRAAPAAVLVGLLAAVQFANLLPDMLYARSHGENLAVAHRSPEETEIYSLKLAQLVLPMDYHRIDSWAGLRQRYGSHFPVPSEGARVSLGAVGAVGFLWLLVLPLLALAGNGWAGIDRRLQELSLFSVTAFLLATTGGISTLIALLATTQLRAWNRMTILLAFLALAAVAVLLDQAGRRLLRRPRGSVLLAALLVAVLTFGVFDQTSNAFIPDYLKLKNDYTNDRVFVHRIEAALPRGAMVYQLPYVPFPEWPPVVKMIDYDHLRGYLHSKHLRWSYGGVKGRPTSDWQNGINQQPVATIATAVAAAGFQGLWVDRFGYSDGGLSIETEIRRVVGPESFASGNGRMSFYDLRPFAQRVRASMSDAAFRELVEVVLHPTRLVLGKGFFPVESGSGHVWSWTKPRAVMRIVQPGPSTRAVTLTLALNAGEPGPFFAKFRLPDGTEQTFAVTNTASPVVLPMRLARGEHEIVITTNAEAHPGAGDTRDIKLQVLDSGVSEDLLSKVRAP